MSELTQSRPYAGAFVPASVILQKLHDHAPAGHVTLDWLMSSLQKQSFGLITLVLAVVAAAPGISLIGGLLLLIPAVQMIAGRPAPTFPDWIATRNLPTQHVCLKHYPRPDQIDNHPTNEPAKIPHCARSSSDSRSPAKQDKVCDRDTMERTILRAIAFVLRCSGAATVAYELASSLGLHKALWAAMSALIVSQEQLHQTRSSLGGFISGTLLGIGCHCGS